MISIANSFGQLIHEDLNLVSRWLARRDVDSLTVAAVGDSVDTIVLVGSSLVGTARVAAEGWRAGVAPLILVSGGIGHSTEDLRRHVQSNPEWAGILTEGLSEAEILGSLLVEVFEVPGSAVVLETGSTHCGANAVESRRVLDERGGVASLVIIQDPTMQMRTHASFERAWKGAIPARMVSYAPFIPQVGPDLALVSLELDPVWTFERFLSLVVGEIDRLTDNESGYGPNGKNFIDHVEMPLEVFRAAERVRVAFEGASSRVIGQ